MKKILAFSGSNNLNSINQNLIRNAADLVEEHEVDILNLMDFSAPIYSNKIKKEEGIPEDIVALKGIMSEYDAYIIASPEHNGSMPSFFKNIIDWLSVVKKNIFNDKPVLLLSAVPGKNGGKMNLESLKNIFPWLGAKPVVDAYVVSEYHLKINQENQNLNADEKENLSKSLDKLISLL